VTWPEQNRSLGTLRVVKVPATGSQIEALNEPAVKLSTLLPDPARSSTLPFFRTVACIARTGIW
jgi:hypothetical protein